MQGMIKRCLNYMLGIYKERKPARRKYPTKKQAKSNKADVHDKKEDDIEVDDDVPKYRPSYHGQHPPYAAHTQEVDKCHAWLLCVLVPTGMPDTKDWVLDLNKTGQFKMDMWKKLVLVYWDFILLILTTIDVWYRFLFRMFADKLLKLLSFRIEKNSVSQLQDEVNEMICLWEALFPDSQNFFQMHQIMDLVSSIPLFGSMHAWSELFGEQALAKLKKIKTRTNPGGVSYENYIMDRLVNTELDTMGRFYSHAVNKKDKKAANYKTKVSFNAEKQILSYNVMQFDIYDREKDDSNVSVRDLNSSKSKDRDPNLVFRTNLNTYELNELVLLLLMEIRKRYKDSQNECDRNSCLCRCFSKKKEVSPSATTVEWLESVVLNDDLYDKDVVLVAKSLLSLKLSFHSKACIYGLQFRSRGSICREFYAEECFPKEPPDRYGSGIYNAREVRRWNDKVDYSSWCKFQRSSYSNKQSASHYGKLNAFFEVRIGDNCIDGLLVASITSYIDGSQIKDKLTSPNVDIVERFYSLDPSTIFVALQDIYPTRIGIVPIAKNHKAITFKDAVLKDDKAHVNLRREKKEMSYCYMLKLDPDKISRYPKWRPYTLYLSTRDSDGSSLIDELPLDETYQLDESDHNHSDASHSYAIKSKLSKSKSNWELRKKKQKGQSSAVGSNDKRMKTWNKLRSVTHSAETQDGGSSSSSSSGLRSVAQFTSAQDGGSSSSSSSGSSMPYHSIATWKPNSYSKVQLRSFAQSNFAETQDGGSSSSSSSGFRSVAQFTSAEIQDGGSSSSSSSGSSMPHHSIATWKPNSNSKVQFRSFAQFNSAEIQDGGSSSSSSSGLRSVVQFNFAETQDGGSSSSSSSGLRSVAQFNFAETQDGGSSSSSSSGSSMPHHSIATWKPNSKNKVQEDVISPDISLSIRNVNMTEEDFIHLSEVFTQQPDTILIDKFHIDMTVAKISCLEQGTWLNDEVINFYVSMLMEDLKQSTRGREIYIFSTFFMAKLNQGGQYSFHLVSRWTKNIDIFGLKKVFIPINIANNHWTLVFIDLTVKTIGYYDAMAGNGSSFMNLTLKVLPSPWRSLFYLYQLIITLSL
jgi:hypothetical protein